MFPQECRIPSRDILAYIICIGLYRDSTWALRASLSSMESRTCVHSRTDHPKPCANPQGLRFTCNPNTLQFYRLYLLIKGYLLLNCRLLEAQVGLSTGRFCLLP